MTGVHDWIKLLDVPSLMLGGVVGALISTWLSYYVKRPVLKVTGGGGGGGPGPGFHSNYIRIGNEPGLMGLRLKDTVLFGFRIHGHIEHGLVIDRSPAHECRAFLFDIKTKRVVRYLSWRLSGNPKSYADTVTLHSGESADLMIFARLHDDPGNYFAYQPTGPADGKPIVPRDEARFNESRDFYIEVSYSYGKKKMRVKYKVVKEFNGELRFVGPDARW